MRSLSLPALATLSLVIGACDRSGGAQPSASASASASAGAAPKVRLLCFDLPGAVRTALAVGADGKHLFYAERVVDGDRDRYDYVSLDLATRKTEVLVRDVGETPERSGDRVVFLRPLAPPERSVAFPGRAMDEVPRRLWSAAPGKGEPVALSPEGMRIGSFAADPKGETAYYSGRERGAARASIWKVPAAGGAPEKVVQGGAVLGFADGGKSLVITAYRDKIMLAKIPIAGGEPQWTAETGYNTTVTDTSVVLLGGPADKRAVQVISLADGKTGMAEGAQRDDLPLVSGAPGYVARDEGGGRALLRVEGGKLVPVVAVTGGDVHAAATLPDGMLATLVSIDTSGDGKIDDVTVDGSDDERDVCLLSPRSAGDEAPRAIPARAVPKRHEDALRRIKKLLEEEPDLASGKLRFLASGRLLVIEAAGAGPADPEALRDRLKGLQKRVGEASRDAKLGVSIRFADSGRHATSLWSEERGRFETWVGVGDLALPDRAGAAVEYTIDYPRTVRVELGVVRQVSADVACAGKVKNVGSEPLDLQIECRAYSPYDFAKEPWTVERGATKPPSLAPNASGSYEVKLPTLSDGNARPGVRFLVNGKLIDAVDTKAFEHDKDWIAALERIRADTGAAPVVDRPYPARTIESYERHPLAAFREPPNFAEASPKQQQATARALWKLVQAHARKRDGGQTPSIALYDAKGKRTFTIDDGKLEKK